MKTYGSVSAVVAAVQDERQIEIERLDAATAAELARLQAGADASPATLADGEARLAAARARAHERLAREDYLDARAELEARETWIRAVVAAGRRRVADAPPDCRQRVLGELADEALAMIPARDCVLQVPRRDCPLGEGWVRARVERSGKRTVEIVPIDLDAGCIASSADGRVAYDNTIASREERLQPLWRTALARMFDEARP